MQGVDLIVTQLRYDFFSSNQLNVTFYDLVEGKKLLNMTLYGLTSFGT